MTFWEKKKAEVLVSIKDKGITVVQSQASSYSNKGGFTPEVEVDPEMQKHLTEAHQKLQEHSLKVREFEGWVQVFDSSPPDRQLQLHADDYLIFFGVFK